MMVNGSAENKEKNVLPISYCYNNKNTYEYIGNWKFLL